jgi:tRNA (guanine37-N1)-methyltransferase
MFNGPMDESIIKRAKQKGILNLCIHNLRDYTHDKHKTVDDKPYGGGPGMLLKPEPLFEALEAITTDNSFIILMTPAGKLFNQEIAKELAKKDNLVIICGSYEGIDERVRDYWVDEELSIGDYILTNGALPAMVVIDAITRLLPGVLGHEESCLQESFSNGLLEYPQYTRPEVFRGMKVPDILLSGNHAAIAKWREEQARIRTAQRRPDLLERLKRANKITE